MKKQSGLDRLQEEHSIKELLQMIPDKIFEKTATILLMILVVTPVICNLAIMPEGLFLRWNVVILQIGYLGILIGIIWMLKQKAEEKSVRIAGMPLCFCLLLIWSVISCLLSDNPLFTLVGDVYRKDGLASYFAYAGILMLAVIISDSKDLIMILKVLVATGAVMAFFGLELIYQIMEPLVLMPEMAVFNNQNHYGYYLCILIPVAFFLFVMEEKKIGMLGIAFEMMLLCNGLEKCHSLGPFIGIFVAIVMAVLLIVGKHRMKWKRVLMGFCICTGSFLLSSATGWSVWQDFLHTFSAGMIKKEPGRHGTKIVLADNFGSGRGILWTNTVKLIKEKPVFGFGPDNLGTRLYAAGCDNDRPHCEVLQIAASLGIPALLFYLAGLADLLRTFFLKFKKTGVFQLMCYCTIGSYLISSLVGNSMYYTTPLFFMMTGFCYHQMEMLEPSEKKEYNKIKK